LVQRWCITIDWRGKRRQSQIHRGPEHRASGRRGILVRYVDSGPVPVHLPVPCLILMLGTTSKMSGVVDVSSSRQQAWALPQQQLPSYHTRGFASCAPAARPVTPRPRAPQNESIRVQRDQPGRLHRAGGRRNRLAARRECGRRRRCGEEYGYQEFVSSVDALVVRRWRADNPALPRRGIDSAADHHAGSNPAREGDSPVWPAAGRCQAAVQD
jgi:hypothetical protein